MKSTGNKTAENKPYIPHEMVIEEIIYPPQASNTHTWERTASASANVGASLTLLKEKPRKLVGDTSLSTDGEVDGHVEDLE